MSITGKILLKLIALMATGAFIACTAQKAPPPPSEGSIDFPGPTLPEKKGTSSARKKRLPAPSPEAFPNQSTNNRDFPPLIHPPKPQPRPSVTSQTPSSPQVSLGTNTAEFAPQLKVPGQKVSYLFVPSYQTRVTKVTYPVDSWLQLGVNKQVHLSLEPQILNYFTHEKGTMARDTIQDGIWKLRWAVLSENPSTSDLLPLVNAAAKDTGVGQSSLKTISSGELLTVATQGRIMAPLSIHFKDFQDIDSRNYLMVEIAPVDPDTVYLHPQLGLTPKKGPQEFSSTTNLKISLKAQTFLGPFIAKDEESAGYLVPYPQNPTLIQWAKEQKVQLDPQKGSSIYSQIHTSWEDVQKNEATPVLSPTLVENWKNKIYFKANNIQSWNLDRVEDRLEIRRLTNPSAKTLIYPSIKLNRDLIGADFLVRAIKAGQLTTELKEKLCFYFFDEPQKTKESIRIKSRIFFRNETWLYRCLKSAKNPKESFFQAQLETLVSSVTEAQFKGSSNFNVDLSNNIRIDRAEAKAVIEDRTMGIDANVRLPILIALGGRWSLTLSQSKTSAKTNNITLGAGTGLNVRKLDMKIFGLSAEQCLTMELNPSLYAKENSHLLRAVQRALKESQKVSSFLNQKVRLCYRLHNPQKVEKDESYYFVTQAAPPVGFLDGTELQNRPLLFQLRGETAFQNFLTFAGVSLNNNAYKKFDTTILANHLTLNTNEIKNLRLKAPSLPGAVTEIFKAGP